MMRIKNLIKVMTGSILLMLGLGLSATHAHHSFAQFDRDTQNIISGEVVRWAFNNPHVWLYINVSNDDGSETLWGFEGSGPVNLLRRSINGRTFEPGDQVTIMHCPLRDGRPGGHIGWAQIGDGEFLDVSDGGCDGDEETIEQWKTWIAEGVMSNKEMPD